MKTLAISAPDDIFDQTVEALCATGGYTGSADDADGKLAFAKEQLITVLGDKNREFAQKQIRQTAMAAIEEQVAAANAQIAATHGSIVLSVDTVD